MKTKVLILFSLYFIINSTSAQNSLREDGSVRFNIISGYNFASNDIWKTHQSMNGPIGGFEIGYSHFTSRKEKWHRILGTPRVGISFQTIFMNKPDTFGKCISLMPHIEIRMFTWPKSEISGKIAIGATYCSKEFNNNVNFDNRAVSSPINFGLEFSAIYHRELTDKIEMNLEASFHHISNGSLSLPNGGYNILYGKAGINYFFDEVPYLKRRGTYLKSYGDKFYYSYYFAGSYRQQGTYWNDRSYPVFTLHQAMMKRINKISTFGIALDAFYDASLKLGYDPNSKMMVSQVQESDKYNYALGLCYLLDIGKLSFPFEAYHYVYNLSLVHNPYYIRFGVKYQVGKNLFIGSFVKGGLNSTGSSFESAFMEFAIGWSFFRN